MTPKPTPGRDAHPSREWYPSDTAIDARAERDNLGRVQAANQLIAERMLRELGAVPRSH